MAKIEVIGSSLVGMANDGHQVAMSRLDLTPWDLQMLLLDPIQKGILFHKPHESANKNIIDHLKHSLSRALDFFPPLAGRLAAIKDDNNNTCFFVDCNNEGAEFTHAIVRDVSVSDILQARYVPEIVSSFFNLEGLIPNCDGVSKPVLGVQVTELVDGLFIGCTANHVVVDGASFWHFFNSWSEISRGFDTISKTPVFERWFPTEYNRGVIFLPPLEKYKYVPPQLLHRVFHFTKENEATLKAEANCDKISSLQAVSAHLWRSVVRCWRGKSSHSFIILPIGTRARIPLPDGYFGNAVYFAITMTSETELLQNGLVYAGLKINELINQQTREIAIKFVDDWVKKPNLVKGSDTNLFVITSSPRHNIYGNDFGWGKPIAVKSGKVQQFDGNMRVHPSSISGGIEVEVILAPETMQALEDDVEFMEAVII